MRNTDNDVSIPIASDNQSASKEGWYSGKYRVGESTSPESRAQDHVLELAKSIYKLLSEESLGVAIDALDVARVFKRRQLLL